MPTTSAADGCQIYYERTGIGPTVALIPGLGGDGRFWSGVASRLADRFDLIIMDHRGAGRSERPNTPYSIATIADDLNCRLSPPAWSAVAHAVPPGRPRSPRDRQGGRERHRVRQANLHAELPRHHGPQVLPDQHVTGTGNVCRFVYAGSAGRS